MNEWMDGWINEWMDGKQKNNNNKQTKSEWAKQNGKVFNEFFW